MSNNTTSWQKYETKAGKKLASKKVAADGDAKPAKGVQNGSVKKATPSKAVARVDDIFDEFIEGIDVNKKKPAAPPPVKNGKVSKAKNGLKIISGDALIQKGTITSKFGEKIRFITKESPEPQAKDHSVKKPSNHAKKPEVNKQKNFKLNLTMLDEQSVRDEIDSLKEVDQDKRCLSLAVYLNVQKPHIENLGWETGSFDSSEPLKSVPKSVEKVLSDFVNNLPVSSAGVSFEIILAELLTKMQSSTVTIWGYRVMLQLLGRLHPDAAILKQHKSLSRLFANSITTGGTGRASAITWAVMQPYFSDAKKAMAIWCKILLPNISNKYLAPVICASLDRLMLTDSLVLKSQTLSHYDYFHLLDYTFPQPGMQNVIDPKTHKTFLAYYPKFKAMSLCSSNVSNFFSSYLSRYKENQSADMREELLTCLATCLRYNSAICYEMWFAMLSSYETQSILFLNDFSQRQEEMPDVPLKPFKQFLDRVSKHLASNNKTADGALASTLSQCSETLQKKPQKNVRFQNDSKRGEPGGKSSSSFLFSPFFLMITLLLVVALSELWLRGNQSYTKHVIDRGVVLSDQSHKWLLKNYPKQTRYVTDSANQVMARIQPIIASGAKWVKNNTPKTLDYIYKDGPLQAYTYVEKNIYPGFSKYFNKNVRPSLSYVSSQLNVMLDVVYASVDLSFLKPYLS